MSVLSLIPHLDVNPDAYTPATPAQSYSPALVGCMISWAMYGASAGQCWYYGRSYPHDRLWYKVLVYGLFLMDSALTALSSYLEWRVLIMCRRKTSLECATVIPGESLGVFLITASIVFIVQAVYAYRIWIITGRSWMITAAVLVSAIIGLAVSLANDSYVAIQQTISPHQAMVIVVAVSCMLCDALISVSVFYYLHPKRSGVMRTNPRIYYISTITMNMGLLNFFLSICIVIFSTVPALELYVSTPLAIIPKSYINSAYAVLNARKARHPKARNFRQSTIEVPPLPTIHVTTCPRMSSSLKDSPQTV
ncbi:hypothetical protein CONPUDRAFT_164634 [Coniophora puteana RWD-64-598 SS2]|uniref:DUF6534 domain-containing protein n=1 Tax=Coniophora puteana (strain RWD-64-598) TaxID=741705 RepID=A0A5M3MS69_CONPW|nr:uncharacterized protein CONPUDRAFT_164634 [Coniophora puteana RWD-64-598 SS2]EIW81917.1 hypothetical protein CONPUDRAFT_164634 [Coniophora puteana RWD-64-598 SS2]